MRRLALLMVVGVIACGGAATSTTSQATTTTAAPTTTAPTTTTTTAPTTTTLSEEQIAQAELQADTELIANLYRDFSDSWFQGVEAGYESLTAHNHVSLECTVDEFRIFYARPEGSRAEVVVHQDTVQRDDGWILPPTGLVPDGRIYVFQITQTNTHPDFDPSEDLEEVHAAILDDEAYFFMACRPVT